MTLVRVNSADDLAAFSSVVTLGSYEEVFADEAKKAIYDRIYPRTPVVWTDEAGLRGVCMTRRSYLMRVGDWISQGINTLFCGGEPDESLSGRAYRCTRAGSRSWSRARRVINAIFFWQRDHCRSAHESDLARARERLAAEAATASQEPAAEPVFFYRRKHG